MVEDQSIRYMDIVLTYFTFFRFLSQGCEFRLLAWLTGSIDIDCTHTELIFSVRQQVLDVERSAAARG